jgi:hypothetical protein
MSGWSIPETPRPLAPGKEPMRWTRIRLAATVAAFLLDTASTQGLVDRFQVAWLNGGDDQLHGVFSRSLTVALSRQ